MQRPSDKRPFLDGKLFRAVANTANGEVDGQTVFRYAQSGDIVTALYSGGPVVQGQLLAIMGDNGELDMRYHHLNREGQFKIGMCRSVPTWLPDGRIRFDESWQWLSGDQASGRSAIEEQATD
ncbi:MAG: n-acetylglutamate synthase [Rubrivivax sp.]